MQQWTLVHRTREMEMRAVDCPCGEHFEGTNDTQLVAELKRHSSDDHDDEYSEADLRLMVNTSAYDAVPA
jgi:hypothetical protein